MYKICLLTFGNTPWNDRLKRIIHSALLIERDKFVIEMINGYPNKNYDIIFLCGIRVLTKNNFDIHQLRKYGRYIIEFGDFIDDPRDAGANLYFYFNPSNKIIDGKKYLPKIIDDTDLFPNHSDKFTIYVDHYKHQNLHEAKISKEAIKFVFQQINIFKQLKIPFDLYFHSEKGIEKNPTKINLPTNVSQNCKILNYDEIITYYRKTHLFFPTHRETQGMLAQEIGLCGGMTILQPWMYPKETQYQFRHLLYSFNAPINLTKLKELIDDPQFISKNRNHVLKYCTRDIFNKIFLKEINQVIKNGLSQY